MASTRVKLNGSRTTYILHTPGVRARPAVEAAVEKLEADGWTVYWPDRDNPLLDSNTGDGFEAGLENKKQLAARDFIHVLWDGRSSGFLFGLGMAFAFEKPVRVIKLPEPTTWRSFQNLIVKWRASKF